LTGGVARVKPCVTPELTKVSLGAELMLTLQFVSVSQFIKGLQADAWDTETEWFNAVAQELSLLEKAEPGMGTVYISRSFKTKQEARDFMDMYMKQYHPAGYDTRFNRVHYDAHTGWYLVTGTRLASCD
jgi:hypothetical protein